MLGVGVVGSPGPRTGVEVSTYGTAGVLAVESGESRELSLGRERRKTEKERQEKGEGQRRARGTGGGGVIYWLDPGSTVSFSPALAAPTPRACVWIFVCTLEET
ncbi:hypothetical protein ALC60_13414 [Trachymyrmex zeteki]|uniref:Uncharacterized protein n=1 Tax=Mycetomoellerius zeteki TaxID=64791 RepID=A0A151WIJ0_9HYME|nr:hypothetical protein ALC60_13414 [Trachymyrmex zeteki]